MPDFKWIVKQQAKCGWHIVSRNGNVTYMRLSEVIIMLLMGQAHLPERSTNWVRYDVSSTASHPMHTSDGNCLVSLEITK